MKIKRDSGRKNILHTLRHHTSFFTVIMICGICQITSNFQQPDCHINDLCLKRLIQYKRIGHKLPPPSCSATVDWTVGLSLELICS